MLERPSSAPGSELETLEGPQSTRGGPERTGPTPQPGERIGRYLVLAPLGRGAMGMVLSAWDPELDRKVAIKLLRRSAAGETASDGTARLVREAQALARVSHPNAENAIVVGGLIGDNLQAVHFCDDQEAEDCDNLRAFIESWGAHGVVGSACNAGTFFDDLVAAIDDACG